MLLKNDEKLLPLCPSNPSTPEIRRLGVIGYNADIAVTSGGGAAELLSTYKVTPLQGIRSAAQSVLGISPENVPYAVGAPAFRFVPLLDRYLRLNRGDKAEVGGLVEFWNEPFEADGSQKLEPIFSTQTFKSQLLLNDHIREYDIVPLPADNLSVYRQYDMLVQIFRHFRSGSRRRLGVFACECFAVFGLR